MFNHHPKRVPLGRQWAAPTKEPRHARWKSSACWEYCSSISCHKPSPLGGENMINPQMVGSSLSVEDMKRFFVHVVVERGLPYCQKLSFPKRCPVKTKNGVTAQAAKDSCQLFTKASAIRAMGTMPFAIGCTKRLDVSYFSYTFSILSLLQAKSWNTCRHWAPLGSTVFYFGKCHFKLELVGGPPLTEYLFGNWDLHQERTSRAAPLPSGHPN